MNFSEFYFILFPAILITFYIIRYFSFEVSKMVLLFSSIAFLFYVDTLSFIILLLLSFSNYILIKLMRKGFNQSYLKILGVTISLLPLFLYKFSILEPSNIIQTGSVLSLVMPLGLAFYTLQQITALFDATKIKSTEVSLTNYMLFSFFFIYLPSGPLIPYRKMLPQLEKIAMQKIPIENINMGISLFIIGFAKKTIIADPISEWINALYAVEQNIDKEIIFTIFELSYIAWGSVLQFYFEFSAYSDMAIGMALCFGILLPINFNSPLKATNPMAYINSWHMSFMAFVREYVFQPVFILTKKVPIQKLETKYIFAWSSAVFMTFFMTGVWHAPTQSAIYYSVLVAFIMVGIELGKKFIHLPFSLNLLGLGNFLSRIFFLLIITLTSVAFRAPDNLYFLDFFINGYSHFYISMPQSFSGYFSASFDYEGIFPNQTYLSSLNVTEPLFSSRNAAIHILIVTIIIFTMPNSMNMFKLIKADKFTLIKIYWKSTKIQAYILALIFCVSLTLFTNDTGFIYG